jgi:DNA-binding NtrC family response regulator
MSGKGTSFDIDFAYPGISSAGGPLSYWHEPITGVLFMSKICRVLVVEDNEDIQDLLKETFLSEGYRFAVAAGGAEMRRIIGKGEVDVCIIDFRLPGGEDGLALAKEVAAQGYGVILVSGDQTHFDTIEKAGHRFLAKPFPLRSLLRLVDEVLSETRAKCEVMGRRYTA